MYWLTLDGISVKISQFLTGCWWRCWSSVDQVSTKVSIKCQLRSNRSWSCAKGRGGGGGFVLLALLAFLPSGGSGSLGPGSPGSAIAKGWSMVPIGQHLTVDALSTQIPKTQAWLIEGFFTRSCPKPITPSHWFSCLVVFLFSVPSAFFFILLTSLSSVLSCARIKQHDKYRYSRNGTS